MMGYRSNNDGYEPWDKEGERGCLIQALCTLAYMLPLFWLWDRTGFPESLGAESHRGRAGAVLDWFNSYLLLKRHNIMDIVTFAYMWAPAFAVAAWLLLKFRREDAAPTSDQTEK